MADKRISELTNITGANLADADEFVVVDTSASETKAITYGELKKINGNLSFGDNSKAIFGAGSDLQIYHDGFNSYVQDAGTGNLILSGSSQVTIGTVGVSTSAVFKTSAESLLYYNNASKLATTSTGVDVTGTVTADGLTVSNTSVVAGDFDGGTAATYIRLQDDTDNFFIGTNNGLGSFLIKNETADALRLTVGRNGDISFYDTSGTSQAFFWDASAESLGIGTSSPAQKLHVAGNILMNNSGELRFIDSGGTQRTAVSLAGNDLNVGTSAGGNLKFYNGSSYTERMRIDASGNVGIGTSSLTNSPGYGTLSLNGTTGGQIAFQTNTVGRAYIFHDGVNGNLNLFNSQAGNTIFSTNSFERMRIDASGNLLVGKTSAAFGTQGIALRPVDGVSFTRSSGSVLDLNRLSTNGEIIGFYKDGTTVGSIGVSSGSIYIDGASTASGIRFAGAALIPRDNNADADNAIDLGAASIRFDDVYATNALIQTSDRNEKQDIAELDEAERRVAVAAKGLLRKFRWRDAVAEKGDDARIHFGIIAQDLQAAFAAEGLDAGKYAMFIHTTWTDEETGEERSRMGVRYSELLAFIIAAI